MGLNNFVFIQISYKCKIVVSYTKTRLLIEKCISRTFSAMTVASSAILPRGWSGGAMVLGKLRVPGRPTILITVGQGPIALAVGAGGVVWTFLLSSTFSPLSPSLWETARYRLKYCLKGPLNTKPTKQPISYPPNL